MVTVTRLTLKLVIMARFYKKSLLLLSLITFHLSLLTSCQEGREAGDLFGQWRLEGSDTHYISFSGSIIWIKDLSQGSVYGNFQHTGDSLFMQCRSIKGLLGDTLAVEQSFGFKPMDNIRVRIVTLDNDKLVLDKNGQTWSFCKY